MNNSSNKRDSGKAASAIRLNQGSGFDMKRHMIRSGNDFESSSSSATVSAAAAASNPNKPKNHMNEHRRALKEIQQKKQDEAEDARQRAEIAKYTRERLKPKNVRSASSKIVSAGFMPAKDESSTIVSFENGIEGSQFDKAGVDDATTMATLTTGAGTTVTRDFLKENRSLASRRSSCTGMSTATKKREVEPKYRDRPRHSAFGKLPSYLKNRKAEWAEKEILEQKALEMEESEVPPGHVLMAEEDRQEMLRNLSIKIDELNYQMRRLPVARRTTATEAKRERLEKELVETEEAIETFSKDKVYILLDSDDKEESHGDLEADEASYSALY